MEDVEQYPRCLKCKWVHFGESPELPEGGRTYHMGSTHRKGKMGQIQKIFQENRRSSLV